MPRKAKDQKRLRNRDTMLQVGSEDAVVEKIQDGDVELLKTLRAFTLDGYKVKLANINLAPARLDTLRPMVPQTYAQAWSAQSTLDKLTNKSPEATNDSVVDAVMKKRDSYGSTPNRLRRETPDGYAGEYIQVELAYGSVDCGLKDHLTFSKSKPIAINALRHLDTPTNELLTDSIFQGTSHNFEKVDVRAITPLLLNDVGRKKAEQDLSLAPSSLLKPAQSYESLEPDVLVTNAVTVLEAEQENKTSINVINMTDLRKDNV